MMREIEAQLARAYAQRREEDEQARDGRIQEALRRDPEIGQLQDALRSCFVQSTRTMLADASRATDLADQLKADVRLIQMQIRERLARLGLPEDFMEIRYQCGDCKDTGFLGAFNQQVCKCYQLQRVQLMRRDANLTGADGQSFEAFELGVFPEGEQRERAQSAMRHCECYADALSEKRGKLNLVLIGASGLGKTYLLNCIAGRAIQRGVPAMAVTAFHMLGAMRDYHFGQTGDESLLNQMVGAELLLIDDLGTEPMLRNITVEYLFMLLNERMNARRHTVIATNLSPEELQERYNERVASRLMDRQNGEFIRLTGTDLRFRGV